MSGPALQPVVPAVAPAGIPPSTAMHLLDAVRHLRSAGGALLTQVSLHGQLASVEWAEEKTRLLKMLVVVLLGFSCLLCLMLFAGALVLVLGWNTAYRLQAVAGLIAFFALGTALAWRRFQALSALSSQSFVATREELAADMALIRSKL